MPAVMGPKLELQGNRIQFEYAICIENAIQQPLLSRGRTANIPSQYQEHHLLGLQAPTHAGVLGADIKALRGKQSATRFSFVFIVCTWDFSISVRRSRNK